MGNGIAKNHLIPVELAGQLKAITAAPPTIQARFSNFGIGGNAALAVH